MLCRQHAAQGRDQRVEEIEDIKKKSIIEKPSLWIEIEVPHKPGRPAESPWHCFRRTDYSPASYDARSAAFRIARLAITQAI